jgi:hypothetical protein
MHLEAPGDRDPARRIIGQVQPLLEAVDASLLSLEGTDGRDILSPVAKMQ